MKRFKELFEQEPGMLKPKPVSFTKSAHGPKPEKKIAEQHAEEGRFKPTIPRMVKSKGVGPRPEVDSADVKLKEDFGKPTPSAEEVAKKHGVSIDVINKQLEMGIKVEKEHTNDAKMAKEIALDHLNEKPNYYSKLKKYVEMTDMEYQSAGTGAKTLVDKPNKEPMKTYKQLKKENYETDTTEKVEMVQSQLHFIKYACEEILEYIEMGGEVEEWYQVKVAKSFSEFESLHAFIEGESRRTGMKEEASNDDKSSVALKALVAKKNLKQSEGKYKSPAFMKKIQDRVKAGKKLKEDVEQIDEVSDETLTSYKEKAKKSADELESQKKFGKALTRRTGILRAVGKQVGRSGEKIGSLAKEETDKTPFEPTKQKQKVVPGKFGAGYSTARHLARMAMKKQVEKMKPMKESLDESRKAEIVKEIVKKKKNESNSEKFESKPELSSEITKA